MINGNQRTAQNHQTNEPKTALVQPITAQNFCDFAALNYSTDIKPTIDALIMTASEACIRYTGRDLLQREWTYKSDRHPEGQAALYGVSYMPSCRPAWIQLPIGPVVSVDTVAVDGETVTPEKVDLAGRRVFIDGGKDIVIEYTAGYTAIPDTLLTGIKMMALYIYERRGACDVRNAALESGAMAIWHPLKYYQAGAL